MTQVAEPAPETQALAEPTLQMASAGPEPVHAEAGPVAPDEVKAKTGTAER